MEEQERTRETVLYHGSLEELNSRNPQKQYKFANIMSFMSGAHPGAYLEEETVRDLARCGFDGLVNRRTIFTDYYAYTEGTPIVRVK